ncbi:LacI family DNA-binding transcriptional regulator [Promicromonospora xylanilytica]
MADVARLAGVSVPTVSRVVNGYPHVTPQVRARVEAAMEQLRYRPNSVARALATHRTMHLGVVTYALSVTSPSQALFGVSEEARAHGYSTNLVTLDTVSPTSIRTALAHLARDAVDGVVILAPMTSTTAALEGLALPMPVVSFAQGSAATPLSVALDEVLAAHVATRHLLELGHRTVSLVRGPDDWMATEARETGWRRELTVAGRPVPEPIPCPDWSAGAGYRAGQAIAADPDVTAVLASNDQMALGVYRALAEAGRRVPEDVSVVGFDDSPEAPYYLPALTTVRLDFAAAGRVTLRRLLTELGVAQQGSLKPPVPQLVVRESTAPPPTA